MSKRNLLKCDHFQLRKAFLSEFPYLIKLAVETHGAELFKTALKNSLTDRYGDNPYSKDALERIKLLIEYDNSSVRELSTGEFLHIDTITYLWHFLKGDPINSISTDILIDLYSLFELLETPFLPKPDYQSVRKYMSYWRSGLDKDVIAVRKENKERMIPLLIAKIEKRNSATSKYQIPHGATFEEKKALINMWWDNFTFHLTMAIKDPAELNLFLGNTLPDETMETLYRAKKKGIPFFITPYYLSLLNTSQKVYDDNAVRSYIIYSRQLIDTYGSIKAWEKEDVIIDGEPNAAGWLLPDGNNIHRRYPEVAILIPDSIGRACGGICASCQRMYGFQSKKFNFDFESLKPKESWDKKLGRLMEYFEFDPQLRDILITGGDAFMSQDTTLRKILDAVYKMALRKRKANLERADGEKFAEIQRIRLGSRLLAYLPLRITADLIEILREFREKALRAGISQFVIQTHFQSSLEVTPEALKAITELTKIGWIITNQLVYTVAASRRGHTAKLRRVLNKAGVICYYTFTVKGFNENHAVFAPNSRSLQEREEEKIFGTVPLAKNEELMEIVRGEKGNIGKRLSEFLKENMLPFVATDRNVLNLPAIGKSMSFTTVGITKEGKRILKFDHDSGRKHSPVINSMGEVYIVENKSIAEYLRQLELMGENIKDYNSIWGYTSGTTEQRFDAYKYTPYPFKVTDKMLNYMPEK